MDTERWIEKHRQKWQITAPQVKITPKALADLRLYAMFSNLEISGFGKIKIEGLKIIITNLIIFPQRCGLDGTIIDDQAQADFLESLPEEENSENYKLWWHSHALSSLYWSKMDVHTIENFGYADFWLSIVTNRWEEERVRIDFFKPLRIVFDDLPLGTTDSISQQKFRRLLKERAPRIIKKIRENVNRVEEEDMEEKNEED